MSAPDTNYPPIGACVCGHARAEHVDGGFPPRTGCIALEYGPSGHERICPCEEFRVVLRPISAQVEAAKGRR